MRSMRAARGFLVGVALVASIGAWWYFKGPCGKHRVEADLAALDVLAQKLKDTASVMQATPVFLMGPQIEKLRSIQQEARALTVAGCVAPAREAFVANIEGTVDVVLAFLQDLQNLGIERAQQRLGEKQAEAANRIVAYQTSVTMVRECAPFCR